MLFLADVWGFERPTARAIIKSISISARFTIRLRGRIVPRWLQLARAEGIKSPLKSTKPLSEVKADIRNLSLEINLDTADLQHLIAIAEAVKLEFTGNWGDFLMVTPGAIEHFEVDDAYIDHFIDKMRNLSSQIDWNS